GAAGGDDGHRPLHHADPHPEPAGPGRGAGLQLRPRPAHPDALPGRGGGSAAGLWPALRPLRAEAAAAGRVGALLPRQPRRGAGALHPCADPGAGGAGDRRLRRARARPRDDPRCLSARGGREPSRHRQLGHGDRADDRPAARQPARDAIRLAGQHARLPRLRPAAAGRHPPPPAGDAGRAGAAAGPRRDARRLCGAAAAAGLPRLLRPHRLRHGDVLRLRRRGAAHRHQGARLQLHGLCGGDDDDAPRLELRHLHRGAADGAGRHGADDGARHGGDAGGRDARGGAAAAGAGPYRAGLPADGGRRLRQRHDPAQRHRLRHQRAAEPGRHRLRPYRRGADGLRGADDGALRRDRDGQRPRHRRLDAGLGPGDALGAARLAAAEEL
ncbi:MAG: Multidrug resistance transporter, Bcr/CflA family, partial [uncultured Craurococcus sp.]